MPPGRGPNNRPETQGISDDEEEAEVEAGELEHGLRADRTRRRGRRAGTDRAKVALLLSMSGKIRLDLLPREINESFTVYELTLANLQPSPTFLQTKEDLSRFKDAYQAGLRAILRDHGNIDTIHLFPAAPAAIAVPCGRELLPKVDPALLVYDYDKRTGGFTPTLRVN